MIIDFFIRNNKTVASTALFGIAATLLRKVRTLHFSLKVPIRLLEGDSCLIKRKDSLGRYVRGLDLLIIDKVTMGNKLIYECLDHTFSYLRNNSNSFSEITVFLGD